MTITTECPTDQEICDIARNEDIPLSAEAFEIASQYHRISQALSVKLGHENLNWPGFAQWSSKAVGSSLRLGNHSGFLRQLGRHYHVPVAAEPLFRLCMLAFLGGSYGTGLSVANRSIFVEMASFNTLPVRTRRPRHSAGPRARSRPPPASQGPGRAGTRPSPYRLPAAEQGRVRFWAGPQRADAGSQYRSVFL